MPSPLRRTAIALGALALVAGVAACGDDDTTETATDDTVGLPAGDDAAGGGAAGTCLEGTTDCQDTPMDPDAPVSSPILDDGSGEPTAPSEDDFPADAARQRAQDVLGAPEAELEVGADLRIGRRGDEQFMLTEDYVLGRITVELDEVDGTYVVTQSTVELPDGPETFTLDRD